MTHDLGSPTPRLAILIPVFRHPALLVDAIESVLAQRFQGGLRLVVVSDGCPLPETDAVCRDYALARPDIVTYLRKPNGGLSDARNCGIRHVLDHLPSVEAIYMLDADNRLRPDAMARAMAILDEDADADWVYPNIDMFGLPWRSDYGGDYSLLIHTKANICEAGSLIRRRVFEAGVLFDTGFRLGWEDWDFFLTAAQKGFRGRNAEFFGFLYRKRAESMLADSEREQGLLSGTMRSKHKALFSPRSLLQLEQAEAPRFALHTPANDGFIHAVDPAAPGCRVMDFAAHETLFWQAQVAPGRVRVPPFLLVLPGQIMDALRKAGLLHWVMWKLETMLESSAVACMTLSVNDDDRLTLRETAPDTAPDGVPDTARHARRDAAILATRNEVISAAVRDPRTDWIDSLAGQMCQPAVACLDLGLPRHLAEVARAAHPTAVFDLLGLVHRLRSSPHCGLEGRAWGYRHNGIPERGQEYQIVRGHISGSPVYPRVAEGRKHIGFLLPLVEFGGVEKVALQMARGLRAHGWVPHAFVLATDDIACPPDWAEVFETTNLLSDPRFIPWANSPENYLGTEVPEWARRGDHGGLTGMLHWLDAVINFHGGAAVGIMGALRKMGIRTLNSLHLNDLSEVGRPIGNTYLGLAYEHAVDLFVPCSQRLGDWLHGMGVPRDKIVVVPNGPGFDIPRAASERAITARAERPMGAPLNVLFLGRLDRQKGIDRLAEVMARTRDAGLSIAWRVIGKAVVRGAQLAPEIARVLEPPLTGAEDLAAAYAWADVVVLLSRYEGLPLTILEAQRAGAWVIATDVGAVGEAVRPGENGTLLDDATAVEDCVRALAEIGRAPDRFRRAAQARGGDGVADDWAGRAGPLAEALDRLAPRAPAIVAPPQETAPPDGPVRPVARPERRAMPRAPVMEVPQNAV